MDRRLAPCLAIAVAAALAACQNEIPAGPDGAFDLTGEWDFALTLPGDEAGTCGIRGALVLTQSEASLAGAMTVYYRFCGAASSADVAEAVLTATTVAFRAGACSYTGTVLGSPADSIAGEVACGWTSGTWVAARVGPAALLRLDPAGRALVVGAAEQYTATLLDGAGHVLYGRAVEWTSSAPGVAAVSASGLVTAVGPGSATVRAASAGRNASVDIEVSAARFVAAAAGHYHTCALTSSGAAYCWGAAPLGDGTTLGSNTPVPVSGGHTWAMLSAGWGFTCGLTQSGAAYCWGTNRGRLGNGDSASSSVPLPVLTTRVFTEVSAGTAHACGIESGGAAWCWGRGDRGQLGNGARATSLVPVAVSGAVTFAHVSAGDAHTCGVTTAGAAYCWGENGGKLGNADTAGTAAPAAVVGGLTFTTIGTGRLHTCALASGGAAYCWGSGVYGQVGNGSRSTRLAPALVSGGRTYTALSVGGEHNSALTAAGEVWGWGSNGVGQSGDSSRTEWDVPAPVLGGHVFSAVSAGGVHTCGVESGWALYCWGYNSNGQIGDGTRTDRRLPVRVAGQPFGGAR